jgi:hypothetical protein
VSLAKDPPKYFPQAWFHRQSDQAEIASNRDSLGESEAALVGPSQILEVRSSPLVLIVIWMVLPNFMEHLPGRTSFPMIRIPGSLLFSRS